MKARYLTFFSYIGTTFRSSEKLWIKQGRNYPDPDSVQGLIEVALLKFRSLNYPLVTLSSRTDGGVHALNTTAHFDLERFGTGIYDPVSIAYELNKAFYKTNTSITVKKCIRVGDTFSARYNAIRRTYLYRLAVLKDDVIPPEEYTCIGSYIPIEEWKRCHFIRIQNFDIDRFKEGAKYLVGYHDFTTFKKFDKLKQYKQNRREIYSIDVKPGKPMVTSYSGNSAKCWDYWDIEIQGRAFVHNQIRRMIGTLISVAIGKLPPEEIKISVRTSMLTKVTS
ncbi:tRNA pseudouridine synthase domain-containing protein [Phthorimaea operculella]|nr:tRNA pseudouridine synthase domain-containing protein [Phthorimaea operculella]